MTPRRTKRLLSALLLPLLTCVTSACFDGRQFMKSSGSEQHNANVRPLGAVETNQTSSGATSGEVSAGSSLTQTMQAPPSSAVAGAAVSFPPGSIAVATTVSMEQAVPLATPVTAAQLGIFGNIASSGTPLVIQSSTKQDAVTPFTIAVSLPSEAALDQSGYFDRLIILYKMQTASGECYVGIILRSEITIKNGFAYFSTSYFGSYQAVYTNSVVPTPVKVAAPSSALAKSTASALPALQLSARSPLIVQTGSTVTLTGKNFRPSLTLALAGRRVGSVTVASDSSASFFVPSGVPGGVVGLSLEQDGTAQAASLVFAAGGADHPFSTKPASEVCLGEQYYDAAGGLQTGTRNCAGPSACTADGQTGCVASSSYPAALASGLASKVVSGQTVAGTTGTVTLPPASYVLTGTSYGIGGTALSGSLTLPAASLVSVAAGSYGVGGTGSLSGLINCSADGVSNCVTSASFKSADMTLAVAGNIKSGAAVAGVTGSYAPPCSSDGQQNCLASGVFKAGNPTGISTWDLRAGQQLAGVAGALKTSCRNAVNTSNFNYDGPVAALPYSAINGAGTADYWDTVDDGGLPTTQVTGWSSDNYCDASTFSDVTTINGGTSFTSCGSSSTCIYKDLISNLQVTGVLASGAINTTNPGSPASLAWNVAVNTCAGSTYGGYAAGTWRLPTQKELLALTEHGLSKLAGTGFAGASDLGTGLWSATTYYGGGTSAWVITTVRGSSQPVVKTGALSVVCVK